MHTLTCTVPLLSRRLGLHLVRWHMPLPRRQPGLMQMVYLMDPSLAKPRQEHCSYRSAGAKFPHRLSFRMPLAASHPWSKKAPFCNTTAASHKGFPISAGPWKLGSSTWSNGKSQFRDEKTSSWYVAPSFRPGSPLACRTLSRRFTALAIYPRLQGPPDPTNSNSSVQTAVTMFREALSQTAYKYLLSQSLFALS